MSINLVGNTNYEKGMAIMSEQIKAIQEKLKMTGGNLDNATIGMTGKFRNTVQLLIKLEEAEKNSAMVELEEGIYELPFQIKITKQNFPNVKGIKGAGRDKTVLKYGWGQEIDWDPDTNKTDARWFGGILINGVKDKVLKDFKIEYTGEFYREGNTYFGAINNIHINNSSGCLVENVESTGANRMGIYLTSNEAAFTDNDKVFRGELSVDNLTHHSMNNRVVNCYCHHNRVAGISAANQINCIIENNVLERNGHEKDGGTGYGFASGAGSVNVNMIIRNNRAIYNYRKGIDSHDAYDFIVKDNHIEGNRLFGIAIESRGYPQRKIEIEGNKIIQDPKFRLAKDDDYPEYEKDRNRDYYRYTSIRIENKSQPNQAWRKQPANVSIKIKNNEITSIEWDGRGVHRVFEIRNNEQATHVRLSTEISGNTINGKNVHNIFFGAGPGHNGLGDFVFKNNKVTLEQVVETPFYIQETNRSGEIGGVFEVSGNTLNFGKTADQADNDIMFFKTDVRPLIKFNGNTLQYAGVRRYQFGFASQSQNSTSKFEIMNNTWTGPTKDSFTGKFINLTNIPAANVNVYNNKAGEEVITFEGATTNAESATPKELPAESATPKTWEETYAAAKPTATVTAPAATYTLNWEGATAESVSSADGQFTITKAEGEEGATPKDYPGLIDKEGGAIRARLKFAKGSAGAYGLVSMPLTERITTILLPIKVINLGGRSKTGAIVAGAFKSATNTAVDGAIVFVEGSTEDKFRITRPLGVTVDGKVYKNEELSFNKTYVISMNVGVGADRITIGSAYNGNGMASVDIGKDLAFFNRSMSEAELQAAALEIVKKVKPEVLQ